MPRYAPTESVYGSNMRHDYLREMESRSSEENEFEGAGSPFNRVDTVHWYIKDNAKLHHTIQYDYVHDKTNAKPVLRRGQPFYLAIRFATREFDLKVDRIVLNFTFGSKPSVSKDTMGIIPVMNTKFSSEPDSWDCMIDSIKTNGKDVILKVYIPPSAPVGLWKLLIRSGLQNKEDRRMIKYMEPKDIVILFNPWCKDDLVYLEDEKEREEYIMNDKGKLFKGGNARNPRGFHWALGQFDEIVLHAAFYILELGGFPSGQRGNPIMVARAITCGVNDNYYNGILEGNWSGDYSDGVAPYKWVGTVGILDRYVRNRYRPVKYAQCWVYSAVTTSICRALGIPCRSVTNYESAHDSNASLTIDKFFDEHGKFIEAEDSIWNYHVWNDVWMARPDLPKGYGGWQAIDSTPQEPSENKMQCGPASLEAIRKGNIGLGFDCGFVYSEVNADVIHWKEDPTSSWGYSRMRTRKYYVGRQIVTRAVGEEDPNGNKDANRIIYDYKNPEGSVAERLAVHNAVRGSIRARRYYEYDVAGVQDVQFELVDIDTVQIGDTFHIKIKAKNESKAKRTVSAAINIKSMYYNGVHHSLIKKSEFKGILKAGEEQEFALTVQYKEYWKRLQEQCMIKTFVIARVDETGQTWSDEDDFQIEKPLLDIQAPSTMKAGAFYKVLFTFTNPLEEELTDCHLSIDGSGLLKPRDISVDEDVEPKKEFKHTFKFIPKIHGQRKLVVNFNSKQLLDISGAKIIDILKQ